MSGFFSGWGQSGSASFQNASLRDADIRSPDGFAGASTISATPMTIKDSHAHQFSACDQISECLHRHKRGVGKARPCRESNQAAICRWITGCQRKKMPSVT